MFQKIDGTGCGIIQTRWYVQ